MPVKISCSGYIPTDGSPIRILAIIETWETPPAVNTNILTRNTIELKRLSHSYLLCLNAPTVRSWDVYLNSNSLSELEYSDTLLWGRSVIYPFTFFAIFWTATLLSEAHPDVLEYHSPSNRSSGLCQ